MSRSYRKTPVFGNTTARSEKEDKRILNRTWRSKVRQLLTIARRHDSDSLSGLILPDSHGQIMSMWGMAKDGRNYDRNFERRRNHAQKFCPWWKAMGK